MSSLSIETKRLISHYQDWQDGQKPQEGIATIHVDEIASRVATFYEKLRKVVDWREEHLMRRIAIERILKRRLLVAKNGHDAESFLLELIRGGHFLNDSIPRAKIDITQRAIDKYVYIIENCPKAPRDKLKSELYIQLLGMAACEVEEILDPPSYLRAQALVEYMCSNLKERIVLGERARKVAKLDEQEINLQLYISVQQALTRSDQTTITYNLFKTQFPNWLKLSRDSDLSLLKQIAQNIYQVIKNIEQQFTHPLANKFFKVCRRYSTPYLLVGDMIATNAKKIADRISDSELIERLTRAFYNKRVKNLKSRNKRAAVYSTISIFVTKVLFIYAIEVPLTKYTTGQFYLISEIVDIVVPTLLIIILVSTVRLPKEGNLRLVTEEVKKIVYQGGQKNLYEIDLYPEHRRAFKIIIGFLYSLSFIICLGVIVGLLRLFKFPILSYFIFIIFTSLIAFAGTKIRQAARELDITPAKVKLIQFFIDPFALPIIRLGKWISGRWVKYNIVAVALNLLIDTPFSVFAEFIEHWRNFIKEKREDIH